MTYEDFFANAIARLHDERLPTRLRAHTKPGLAIKLRLLAELYGEAVGGPSDDSDMVSVLLSSLIEDMSEQ